MDSIQINKHENCKNKGHLNEYLNSYKGLKFEINSDGIIRFIDIDGSIKIRTESGIFIDANNANNNNEPRRSTLIKVSHSISQPPYEFLNFRSRLKRKSDNIFGLSNSSDSLFSYENLKGKEDNLMTGSLISNNDGTEQKNCGNQINIDYQTNKETRKRKIGDGIEDSDNDDEISSNRIHSSASNEENNDLSKITINKEVTIPINIQTNSKIDSKKKGKQGRRRYLEGSFIAEKILDVRGTGKGMEYLVQWVGYSDHTWEWANNFQHFTKLIEEFNESLKNKSPKNNEKSNEPIKRTVGRPRKAKSYFYYVDDDEYKTKRPRIETSTVSDINKDNTNQDKPSNAKRRTRSVSKVITKEEQEKIEKILLKTPEQSKDVGTLDLHKKRPVWRRGPIVNVNSSEVKELEVPEVITECNDTSTSSSTQPSGIPSFSNENSGDEGGIQTIAKKITNFAVTCGAIPLTISRMRVDHGKEPELLVKYRGDQFADEWVPLSIFSQYSHQSLMYQFIFKFLFKVSTLLHEKGIKLSEVET
ncbi:Chromo domain-containing protein [Meloidogyne graminicola]|uniref:Chromo domain-containing protein n=1 Tax=Meloidogyne graminicola TaxID=189291 RepID=A0A8S9ZV94_9BILA|nr:Chromo domain-containing protein [Meloidogyne graminicola]